MNDLPDDKTMLRRYLQDAREALVWKLDGLSERQVRMPRTPTGTNLLGLVKHCLNVEVGYFGATFGRVWPTPEELVPFEVYDVDPQADWYATADETAGGLVDLYRRVWVFADATIDQLPLDAPGRVPWWPDERADVTLHRVITHVTGDVTRHAGHADILREQIDGSSGLRPDSSSLPDIDWPAYLTKLQRLADSAGD